jgi:uncharacterized protein
MHKRLLSLTILEASFAVCRLDPGAATPVWATGAAFYSVTRTQDEWSLVCPESAVPDGIRCEVGWQCLRVVGTMDFSEIGILASLVGPLAEAGISVFAISTFYTDYLLVKHGDLKQVITVLRQEGHTIPETA